MRQIALQAGERVYRAIKAELLSGVFSPGERIEASELGERHRASITPIRAALHRLAGEQLVDARPGEGFQAPVVTEVSLRDLYAWNGHILQLGWQLPGYGSNPSELTAPRADHDAPLGPDIPAATASLFAAIGRRSDNEHCAMAIEQLNDRLHLARRLETELVDDLAQEFDLFAGQLMTGLPVAARQSIAAYHRRRIRLAADLVRLMHRRPR